MNLGSLVAHLTIDNKSFLTGMNAARSSLDSMSNKMRSFGIQWGLLVTTPLTLFGKSSVSEFGKFNQAIVRSAAVLKDSNVAMRSELTKTALELSLKVATSAVHLAEGFYEMGQAGLDSAKAMQLLPVVEEFAYVGTMNLSKAVSYLTKSQRALGMEMQDPIKNMIEMKRVADNLTYAAIESTAGVLDFSEAMKNAGPMLRVLNKSVEEGVSALMTLANQGHVGSEAGTQLYMVYRDLQRAFITHKSTWRALSIDVYDVNRNMRLLPDIIKDLEERFAGMTDEGTRSALMMMGFQDRSLRATQAMLGQSRMMARFYKDLQGLTGITKTVAETFRGAFFAQMDMLRNKLKYIQIAIGEIVANQLTKLNDIMNKILKVWKDLSQPAKEFIVYFLEVAVAIGPVAIAMSYLVKGFGSIIGIITSLISPLGLLLGLFGYIALSSKTVTTEFGNITDSAKAMYKIVSEGFNNWTTADTLAMERYVKVIAIELNGLKDKFSNFINYLQEDFSGATAFIGTALLAGLKLAFQNAVELAIRGSKGIWKAVKEGLSDHSDDQFWIDRQKKQYQQAQAQYKEMMKKTPGGGYKEETYGTDATVFKVATNQRMMDRIDKEIKDSLDREMYARWPDIGEAATGGASEEDIKLMVSIKLRNESLKDAAVRIVDSVWDGTQESMEANFEEFWSMLNDLKTGKGNTSAATKAYLDNNALIDARTLKAKEAVLAVTKELTKEEQKRQDSINWTNYFIEQEIEMLKKASLEDADRVARVTAADMVWAENNELKKRRQAIASLYQGMEGVDTKDNSGLFIQLDLLRARKILLKSEVGDHEQLAKWEGYQLALLGQMGNENIQQQKAKYEAIKDSEGAYRMQLRLIENEAKLLPFIVEDEKLRAEWIEKQKKLALIDRLKGGDTWAEGFKAFALEAEDAFKTAGERANEFAQTMEQSISSRLQSMTKDWDNWGDHILGILTDIVDSLIRINIIEPAAKSAAGLFGGLYNTNNTPQEPTTSAGAMEAAGNAIGNAFFQGQIIPFRNGGIISQPSITPMASMAEEGPEAIMPLSRASDNKLGVIGKIPTPEITFNIENRTSSEVEQSNTDVKWDGRRMLVNFVLKDKRNRGPISRGSRRG